MGAGISFNSYVSKLVTLLQKQLQLNNLSDNLLRKHSFGGLILIYAKALFSALVWIGNFKTW